jgi:hypothetical protein
MIHVAEDTSVDTIYLLIQSIARKLALLKIVIRCPDIYLYQQDDQFHCEIILFTV